MVTALMVILGLAATVHMFGKILAKPPSPTVWQWVDGVGTVLFDLVAFGCAIAAIFQINGTH